jgi:hypothetical protein
MESRVFQKFEIRCGLGSWLMTKSYSSSKGSMLLCLTPGSKRCLCWFMIIVAFFPLLTNSMTSRQAWSKDLDRFIFFNRIRLIDKGRHKVLHLVTIRQVVSEQRYGVEDSSHGQDMLLDRLLLRVPHQLLELVTEVESLR